MFTIHNIELNQLDVLIHHKTPVPTSEAYMSSSNKRILIQVSNGRAADGLIVPSREQNVLAPEREPPVVDDPKPSCDISLVQ